MIIHIHIYKNGGTTFNQILSRCFGQGHVQWYPRIRRSQGMSEAEMRELIEAHREAQAISSHQLRYPCPAIPGVDYQYVTFLRHPLERALSMYFFEKQKRAPQDSQHRAHRPLEEFLAELRHDQQIARGQCRHLHPSATFEKAVETLEAFTLVGVVERYDESLTLASYRLGLPLAALIQPRANASRLGRLRTEYSPRLYKELINEDDPDMALYRWAQDRLAREIQAMHRRFFFEVALVKTCNQALFREREIRGYVGGKIKGALRKARGLMMRMPRN